MSLLVWSSLPKVDEVIDKRLKIMWQQALSGLQAKLLKSALILKLHAHETPTGQKYIRGRVRPTQETDSGTCFSRLISLDAGCE